MAILCGECFDVVVIVKRGRACAKMDSLSQNVNKLCAHIEMSALARYFYGCDDGRKKGNEVVSAEDDDVGSSACDFQSLHFASVAFDA